MQRNLYRDREQVNHISDLIIMNTYNHATPPPLVPVVSDDDSGDDSIGAPQVSERESLGEYGPSASPIPHEPPPRQSSEEAPEGAHSEEASEGATPGRPIW